MEFMYIILILPAWVIFDGIPKLFGKVGLLDNHFQKYGDCTLLVEFLYFPVSIFLLFIIYLIL